MSDNARKMNPKGLKPPLAVEIEIGSDCNRRCPYCPNSSFERPERGAMEDTLFLGILKQLSDLNYEGRISYHFFNEPLLSPSLSRFVALTRDILPRSRIEIFTNGTLLNQEKLRELLDLGVHKFTVTRHIGSDLAEFEDAYARLSESDKGKIIYYSHQDLIFTNRGGLVQGFGSFKVTPPLDRPCFVPISTSVITVKGNVLPCFQDFLQRNVMGNVQEQHFGDIWASQKYIDFRNRLREGKRAAHSVCSECDYILVVS
ncbi:MAG: hypothetical protein A2X94_08040 [Bdellovibrionales bacterium GWB1_55_8]|nr:MAG: hypothetical protein A2X94_08040 [Bdellovibrionales bacterium GWB1_55_8]